MNEATKDDRPLGIASTDGLGLNAQTTARWYCLTPLRDGDAMRGRRRREADSPATEQKTHPQNGPPTRAVQMVELIEGLDWVIAGGESGPKARPIRREWVDLLREQCARTGVAFFFKQWGRCERHGWRMQPGWCRSQAMAVCRMKPNVRAERGA